MATADGDPAARAFVQTAHHDTYDFIKPRKTHSGDRKVLITGASRGIGAAIAIAYARAGYSHIAVLARSSLSNVIAQATEAAHLAGHSPVLLGLSTDLCSVASVDAAAAKVQSDFGSLDVMINNAGYLESWTPIVDSDPEEWWKTWEVNVKGTYLVNRAFVPLLLRGSEKTSISVSSVGAWVTKPGGSAYQGSKTAQVRMINHLMAEYGDQGLLAFAIHPGNVKTELALGMPGYMHETLQDEPEMAADTLVWLTQERRPWLADRYVAATWDMQELLAKKDEIVSNDLLKLNLRH